MNLETINRQSKLIDPTIPQHRITAVGPGLNTGPPIGFQITIGTDPQSMIIALSPVVFSIAPEGIFGNQWMGAINMHPLTDS